MSLVACSELQDVSGLVFSAEISFFQPHLGHYAKETLEIGGQVYVCRDSQGAISGLFTYDHFERVGTIYTRSREVFDCFRGLKNFNFLFCELMTELEKEVFDVYVVELPGLRTTYSFRHEITVASEDPKGELEQFMLTTHPGINRRWVDVALRNGDRCFAVKLQGVIAGLGWLTIVNGVGRLHSLFVKPQFRGMGIGEDILFARLLWARSKKVRLVFSEISRLNPTSYRIAMRANMVASGQVYLYSNSASGIQATLSESAPSS